MKNYLKLGVITLVCMAGVVFVAPRPTHAAPVTFTVNSIGNGLDQNLGNGICETINAGECTLLAAIDQANNNGNPSEQDVIEFSIPGAGPHKITLGAGSLIIRESVFINGYSEPGASANTTSNPEPMNGALLIEIDGSDTVEANGVLTVYSSDVTVRGLVINSGRASQVLTGDVDNVTIAGNYLGTDVSGMVQKFNPYTGKGDALGTDRTSHMNIGGSAPEDRNVIISYGGFGVSEFGLPIGDPNISTDVKIQGNNIFVGSDSVTPLAPIEVWGSLGIRNAKNITIGGDNPGEGNIIENASNSGIDLTNGAKNIVIAGNRIVASQGQGITTGTYNDCCGGTSSDRIQNIRIGGTTAASRNIISDSTYRGIFLSNTDGATILGNYIGLTEDGMTDLGNGEQGIGIQNSSDISIGSPTGRNVIAGNGYDGIRLDNSQRVTIQNNYIGIATDGATSIPNTYHGISAINVNDMLIGGTGANQANLIKNQGNFSDGVAITENSYRVSVLGNSIYDNSDLGIDIMNNGVSVNDDLDPDSGPNDVLNYPVVYTQVAAGLDTSLAYYTDLPAGDYRIEFFSNPSADDTGFGQGQTFIGFQNITSLGSGRQEFSTTLTGNTHTNIFATATQINGDSFTGFGATSEFGNQGTPPVPPEPVADLGATKTLVNPGAVAYNAALTYDFELKNHGPDEFDLTSHMTPLTSNPLISDYLPPDLTPAPSTLLGAGPIPGSEFIDVGNTDLTCLWAGPGSAGLYFGETVNPDYSIVACWYTGMGTELINQGTIDFSIDFAVANDSELAFTNFVATAVDSSDPDANEVNDLISEYPGDFVGAYKAQLSAPINNLAGAPLSTDVGVTTNMVNPSDFAPGATIYYDVNLLNRGPAGIDVSDYFGLGNLLLAGTFNGANMSLVGATTPGILCLSIGPGTAIAWGAAAQDHPGYDIYICGDDGSNKIIAPGETYTVRLQFTVNQNVSGSSNFYAGSFYTYGDPDNAALFSDFFGATQDVLDTIGSDNFARVTYPLASTQSNISNVSSSKSGSLSGTGENIKNFVILATVLLVIGAGTASVLYIKRSKKK